jgi:hypothetical protein
MGLPRFARNDTEGVVEIFAKKSAEGLDNPSTCRIYLNGRELILTFCLIEGYEANE